MRFQFPVSYKSRFVLIDGKKPIFRNQEVVEEFEIPEVSGSEAYLAASWFGHQEVRIDLRTFDGDCYIAATHKFNLLTEHSAEQHVRFLFAGQDSKTGDLPSRKSVLHPLGSDIDERLDEFRKKANSLLLIDGILYGRIPKPSLVYDENPVSGHIRIEYSEETPVSMTAGGPAKGIDVRMVGPISAAELFWEKIASTGRQQLGIGFAELNVIDPDVVHFDMRVSDCRRTIYQALVENQSAVNTFTDRQAIEFFKIREAYGYLDADLSVDVSGLLQRTYDLLIPNNLYNHSYVASFLRNFDTAMSFEPDIPLPASKSFKP